MSKVFLVRLSRYSIYKVQLLPLCGELVYTNTSKLICQELFSSFFKFLFEVFCFAASRRLAYISRTVSFCQHRKTHKTGASFEAPKGYFLSQYRQSDHIHRRFCGRPQQTNRRYLHRGMRRRYAPADSSAEPLLPGSWV